MTILSAIFTLVLIMDPLGNIPLFISALKNVPAERRKRVIVREHLIALGFMVFFLFFGSKMLGILRIDPPSLTVAGGIVLFLIAIQMIFPSKGGMFAENPGGEPFMVPLAIPLISGPSVLTTLIIFAGREPHRIFSFLLALACAWMISALILFFSEKLSRLLGERGLMALERLMGMILTTIAVQMLLGGIKEFLKS